MSKIPRPTVRVARLISAGYGEPRFTKHVYVDTRECVDGSGPAYEHIFRCEETGEERRYGVETRTLGGQVKAAPADSTDEGSN